MLGAVVEMLFGMSASHTAQLLIHFLLVWTSGSSTSKVSATFMETQMVLSIAIFDMAQLRLSGMFGI